MQEISSLNQRKRHESTGDLLGFIRSNPPVAAILSSRVSSSSGSFDSVEAKISNVKNLFARVYKQHTWDWFRVRDQLGQPDKSESKEIVKKLEKLIHAIKDNKEKSLNNNREILSCRSELQKTNIVDYLNSFQFPQHFQRKGKKKGGKIYILSTEQNPDYLKIGCTTQSVYKRVQKLNNATGILVPLGIKKFWNLKIKKIEDVEKVEGNIHKIIDRYRIRKDREFFHMKLDEAINIIDKYIEDNNLKEF